MSTFAVESRNPKQYRLGPSDPSGHCVCPPERWKDGLTQTIRLKSDPRCWRDASGGCPQQLQLFILPAAFQAAFPASNMFESVVKVACLSREDLFHGINLAQLRQLSQGARNLFHDGDAGGTPQRLCPKTKSHWICHLSETTPKKIADLQQVRCCAGHLILTSLHLTPALSVWAKPRKWRWRPCCSQFLQWRLPMMCKQQAENQSHGRRRYANYGEPKFVTHPCTLTKVCKMSRSFSKLDISRTCIFEALSSRNSRRVEYISIYIYMYKWIYIYIYIHMYL